jgi:intracellular septation protein A
MTALPRPRLATVIRVAADFVLPLVVYYGLRRAGVGVYVALIAGSLLSASSAAVSLVRTRQLDGLAAYMTTMMLGSVGVSLLFGSTRFLLAKGALLTGVTGIWFIASAWTRRPLAYHLTRPLLEGRFRWPPAWDELWERAPLFRRMWRVSSVLFGIGSLLDATLRVVMAYTLPPDRVPILSTGLYAATSLILIVVTNVYYILCGVQNPSSAMYRDIRPVADGESELGSGKACTPQPAGRRGSRTGVPVPAPRSCESSSVASNGTLK